MTEVEKLQKTIDSLLCRLTVCKAERETFLRIIRQLYYLLESGDPNICERDILLRVINDLTTLLESERYSIEAAATF